MKTLLTFTALVVILLSTTIDVFSQNPILEKRKPAPIEMLNNSAQGREFWIAIPPNEVPNYTPNVLEIYVTSAKRTKVTLTNPTSGLIVNKVVEPLQITTFTSARGEIGWEWEVRESEQITNKGLKLEADQPISVYVLNAKTYSSDGYLALPVTALGKEYYHMCYYDFLEYGPWASGFVIVAPENDTKITIKLNGKGKGAAKTLMGRNIGDVIQVTLQEGQTYMVRGDATTRGLFDLSGSKIIASKPVGLISFHMRTIIPSFDINNGRDHMSEMLPPIHAWGKKYVTVEYKRDKGQGDFFRIMASEDNTNFKCVYYDKDNGNILGNWEGQLKKAGDFEEYLETHATAGNQLKSIHGTSVWTADKPVLLHHYSYSEQWDGATVFDPFMIISVPEEQFITSTVFQTPANKAFITNWFNIVAKHDPNDLDFNDLKSIKIDGTPITQIEARFTYNQIPNTDMYWAKIPVTPGAHRIAGDGKVKFGGYIYGFSNWDSYGWPAAMAINKLDEVDTLPPVLARTGECGSYIYQATELRNGLPNDDPRQVDQGIVNIELLDGSYNYELTIIAPNPFKTYPPVYEASFALDVINKYEDAFAIFSVTDKYGNYTIDSVSYDAAKLELIPKELNFGNVRLTTSKTLTAQIKNIGDSVITVKEIKLQWGDVFKIVSGGAPPEFDLLPNEIREIVITYTPKEESPNENIRDKDSIEVITECDTAKWYIHGRGVVPKILVEDWDAGAVIVGNKVCKETQTGTGLKISNTGTDVLTITDIKDVTAPFSLSVPYIPGLPIVIQPKSDIWLVTPCFTAPDVNTYTIDVTFASDAQSGDSISTWMGRGILSGPYVTSWDFGRIRENSVREGKVYVRNSGNAPVKVSGVRLRDGNLGFSIKPGSVIPEPSIASPIDLFPESGTTGIREIELTVIYNPQGQGDMIDYVEALFDEREKIPDGTVYNFVKGFSYLPEIVLNGYEFVVPILSGTVHPEDGEVVITSTSSTAPLYIEEIRWKDPAQTQFSWVGSLPSKISLNEGEKLRLPVRFHPNKTGKIIEEVEVVNDANRAPDSIIVTAADVIGWAYLQGIQATDIDYGMVITCNRPESVTTVTNTGSGDIEITGVEFLSGDVNSFELVDAAFPINLPPGESRDIKFRFLPDRVGNFSAQVRINTDMADNPEITIKGIGYVANLSLSMMRYNANENLAPGFKILPEIRMNLDLPVDANITKLEFDIVYKKSWMMYDKYIEKGPILGATWNVNATETEIDDVYSKLTITIEGTNPLLVQNGVLVVPRFLILLADVKEFEPQIENINADDRNDCVVKSATPGLIVLNTCVIDLRGVITSGLQYQIHDVEPNPASGSQVAIKYSLSFDGQTTVELVNGVGELVGLLVNDMVKAGTHEVIVPTDGMPSGTYFIRLKSGHYSESKSFVLIK